MSFKYFTETEILNPFFDDCPHDSFSTMPPFVRKNLFYTMNLIEDIRRHIKSPIRINSSYRVSSSGRMSAHAFGKAIDFQFINGRDSLYLEVMDYLASSCPLKSYRAILEWKGRGHWIHIDRGYRDIGKEVLMIGYPVLEIDGDERMVYRFYNGFLPRDVALKQQQQQQGIV